MSWRDRPYASEPESPMRMQVQFRRPSSAVLAIIIANVAIFFLDVLSRNFAGDTSLRVFGLSMVGIESLMLWQPVSYMFMHGGVFHLLINMLLIYVCGSEFERHFGQSRFLQFYFICGVMAGLAYLVLAWLQPDFRTLPLVGASGSGYGLLLAAMIFFPHIQVILFIIPMPIRVFGMIMIGMLLLEVISPGRMANPGGQVAHVAGAVTGLVVLKVWSVFPGKGSRSEIEGPGLGARLTSKYRTGAWERKQRKLAEEEAAVDRILAKIREKGIQSLSRSEKKLLTRATQRQKQQESRVGRTDRL